MKKPLIISLLLSIIISGIGWIYYSFFAAAEIIDYTIDDINEQLYTITKFSRDNYLQINNKSGQIIHNIRLPQKENESEKNYLFADYLNGKLYISGYLYKDVKTGLFIDCYDNNGNFEKQIHRNEDLEKYNNHYFNISISENDNVLQFSEILDKNIIRINLINTYSGEADVHLFTPRDDITVKTAVEVSDIIVVLDENGNLYSSDKNGNLSIIDTDDDVIYDIKQNNGSDIYYIDASTISGVRGRLQYSDDGSELLFKKTVIHKSEKDIGLGITFDKLRSTKYTARGNYLCLYDEDKTIYYLYENQIESYPVRNFTVLQIVFKCLTCLALSFLACICICLIIQRVFASRKIFNKQIITMLLIVVIIPFPIMALSKTCMSLIMQHNIADYMVDLVHYFKAGIDGDYFEDNGLTKEQEKNIYNFNSLILNEKNVNIVSNQSSLLYNDKFLRFDYCEIAKLRNNEYYYEFVPGKRKGGLVKYDLNEKNLEKLKSKRSNDYVVTFTNAAGTQWLEATSFICNSEGAQVGYIQLITDNSKINEYSRSSSLIISILTELVVILLSISYLLILRRLLTPLKSIKNATTAIAGGKIDTVITGGKTNDELQDISESFNDMSLKLSKYFESINLVSKAYEKFVPKDFFLLMGKDNIFDVKPGERVQCILTFLFINVNNYIYCSDDDGFMRINNIYSVVADKIKQKGGIIQSYDDDAILVIYKSEVNNAVEAALEINERINSVLAQGSAALSFTVQNKTAFIGVIGSQSTMKCISVSPAINLQYHINRIINIYKLGFIITDDAYSLLTPELQINCRYAGTIDMLLPDIENNNAKLYEVIDIYDVTKRKQKLSYKTDFETALELYCCGEFKKSRSLFINALRINREDLLVKHYLSMIEERHGS